MFADGCLRRWPFNNTRSIHTYSLFIHVLLHGHLRRQPSANIYVTYLCIRKYGRKHGRKEGRKEGMQEARKEGRKEHTHSKH